MIRPIGPLQNAWVFKYSSIAARSEPLPGALSQQLDAVERRRSLSDQQEDLQAGQLDFQALPPYPYRPRPPS
jgi:hypothetical protein